MAKINTALLFDPLNNWIKEYITTSPLVTEPGDKYRFTCAESPREAKGFEIVFILGYTKILGRDFLDSNGLNLVIHESALPLGKGFSPVQWQILEGKSEIPVCLIEAVEEMDGGDIIETGRISLTGYELFDEIRKKQAQTTIGLMETFLRKYPDYTRTKQTGQESVYRRRRQEDDELDPEKSIKEQFNHFRIADNRNYPLYFNLDGHKYFLRISKE